MDTRKHTRPRLGAATLALALAVAALLNVSAGESAATPTNKCGVVPGQVYESDSQASTGTYLTPGRSITVTGTGSIWAGYWLTGTNGPAGWTTLAPAGYPLPGARQFSLIARVGSGPWQYVGANGVVVNTGTSTETVRFGINDNVHGNGSGHFDLTYTLCNLSDSPGSQYQTYFLHAVHSDKCLDVADYSRSPGANVQQWTCLKGTNQLWTARPVASGYYQIVARGSGQCLDVANAGLANGDNVRQEPCSNAATSQQWMPVQRDFSVFEFRSRASGRCLDVSGISTADGANVFVWDCLGGPNQRWRLIPDVTL